LHGPARIGSCTLVFGMTCLDFSPSTLDSIHLGFSMSLQTPLRTEFPLFAYGLS
jgi:hypothetical protein